MKKKLAGMPVWLIVAIVAAGGYYVYTRYRKSKEEEGAGGEGLYPTTGPAPEAGAGAGAPGGGAATLGEQLNELEQIRDFTQREPTEKPEPPAFFESLFERLLGERLEPNQAPKSAGGKGKGKAKRPKGPSGTHRRATHQHTASHGVAKHPRQRIGVGQNRPAKQPRNRAPAKRRRR